VSPDLGAEGRDRIGVAGHGEVGEVSVHHASQPLPLQGDGFVPASLELFFDLTQLGPHSLLDRGAPDPEPSALGRRAQVREAEEVERLGLPDVSCCSSPGGVPPELDQPGFVRVQLQPELRESLSKVGQEPLRILLMLEAGGEIVRLCRAPGYAAWAVLLLVRPVSGVVHAA
jgi:hypothetical protein